MIRWFGWLWQSRTAPRGYVSEWSVRYWLRKMEREGGGHDLR